MSINNEDFAAESSFEANKKFGLDESDPSLALSRWLYDTPGTIQPDQIIHLLTTEELWRTLPRGIIKPRTYNMKAGYTLFVGGLGRIDYHEAEGAENIR